MFRIRKSDLVIVRSGDDASNIPRRVQSVDVKGHVATVEGVNRVYKHLKRGTKKAPQGGRLSKEMPVSLSNLMIYCGACKSGVRVRFKAEAKKGSIRLCSQCGSEV